MGSKSETVCVTGAAGFVGSWLVMRLLELGYTVRATVRDPANMEKVKHLLELPHAKTHLSLWKADLAQEGSFDEAIKGCTGVFHVASSLNLQCKDPQNEMIKPTVNGALDIMKACVKAKSVRRIILTSTSATISMSENQKNVWDESSWSDVEFCFRVKMLGWSYIVAKTMAEKEARQFANENGLDLVTIIPTGVVGPFITPAIPESVNAFLSPITGNEAYFPLIKQSHWVHVDDLCLAHIFLFEEPKAEGRYICNAYDTTIHENAKLINEKYPDYNIPTKFKDIPDELEVVRFSSKKLTDLGFQFKYNLEDMLVGAIDTSREKGLLPIPSINK